MASDDEARADALSTLSEITAGIVYGSREENVDALLRYATRAKAEALREAAVVAESGAHRAARLIATVPYLYSGYEVGSRGPIGLILDALAILHPEARAAFDDTHDWDAVFADFYSEDEEPLAHDFADPRGGDALDSAEGES
jgi:hypothetical protein